MKKLITLLLVLVTLNGYSQYVLSVEDINVDSIEYYMFEMMNEYRETLGKNKRYRSLTCKKAGDHFLDYIKTYNQTLKESGHLQLYPINDIKILRRPNDRYMYFYNEGNLSIRDGLIIKPKYYYTGEIITRSSVYVGKHWTNVKWVGTDTPFTVINNKMIAQSLLKDFITSKGHHTILISSINKEEYIDRGYFRVMITPKQKDCYNIYAIGVFDRSTLYIEKYKKDYPTYSGVYKKIY